MEPQHSDGSCETPPVCPKCQKANRKKRHKLCNACSRAWHLGCVRLSRAQAAALNRWLCPECLSSGRRSSRRRPSSITDDSQSSAQAAAGERGRATSVDGAAALADGGDARLAPAGGPAGEDEETGAGAEDLACHLAEIKKSRRVIPRVPRGARIIAAGALCELMEDVLSNGSEAAWSRLLKFALHTLSRPARAKQQQHETSLTSKIKQQIGNYMGAESPQRSDAVFLPKRGAPARPSGAGSATRQRH